MSDKFKKIDREFCITDNSVNVYGYRCLTEGMLIDEVKKNPIGYLMHNRDKGVVVRWEDFRIDGDKVFAKPVINLSHPDGHSIADQVESGFYNAASVGKIVVLEASDAPELKLKDQTRPTLTQWYPREISLVDIPGNYNALANLYDALNNELNLSDLDNFIITYTMSNTLDAAKIVAALNLSDNAQETEVLTAINNLVDKANKADGYKKDLDEKNTALEDLKAESTKHQVEDLIAKGKSDKKLTNELADSLSKDYATNPKGLEDLLAKLPAQVSVVAGIEASKEETKEYEGKTWDELYADNKLEAVRQKFPDLYSKLKDEKFPNLNA